jgi:hypothetical protein
MATNLASQGIKIDNHSCNLLYCAWDEKSNSAYSGGFCCNICRKSYGKTISNLHCKKCEYDICEKCLFVEVNKDIEKTFGKS